MKGREEDKEMVSEEESQLRQDQRLTTGGFMDLLCSL